MYLGLLYSIKLLLLGNVRGCIVTLHNIVLVADVFSYTVNLLEGRDDYRSMHTVSFYLMEGCKFYYNIYVFTDRCCFTFSLQFQSSCNVTKLKFGTTFMHMLKRIWILLKRVKNLNEKLFHLEEAWNMYNIKGYW